VVVAGRSGARDPGLGARDRLHDRGRQGLTRGLGDQEAGRSPQAGDRLNRAAGRRVAAVCGAGVTVVADERGPAADSGLARVVRGAEAAVAAGRAVDLGRWLAPIRSLVARAIVALVAQGGAVA